MRKSAYYYCYECNRYVLDCIHSEKKWIPRWLAFLHKQQNQKR